MELTFSQVEITDVWVVESPINSDKALPFKTLLQIYDDPRHLLLMNSVVEGRAFLWSPESKQAIREQVQKADDDIQIHGVPRKLDFLARVLGPILRNFFL